MAGADLLDEVWRGGVNAWECDDNAHLNTRFFVMRAMEGTAVLFAQLGMPGLFSPAAPTTAVVQEMHIRFHREARVGTPLAMTGGVVSVAGSEAELLLVLSDLGTGECKATFRTRVAHVRAEGGISPVPWPATFTDRAAARLVALPEIALPRSTGQDRIASTASGARADDLGLTRIGLGAIGPRHLDAFGRMAPHMFIGAVSDGIRALTDPLREIVLRHADDPPQRAGGAVVEFRILHLRWPRAGDTYEIRAGLSGLKGSAKSLIQWMLDPTTGEAFGAMQSIAVDFDLDRRRTVRLSDAARDALQARAIPTLAL